MIGHEAGGDTGEYAGEGIFIGYRAGYHNQWGDNNIFIGNSTGWQNNDGYENVVIGRQGAYDMTDGGLNTMLGNYTGGDITDGWGNVFLGYGVANRSSTGADMNVLVGYNAGNDTQIVDGNVMIGYNAGSNVTSNTSDKLYIENSSSNSPLIWGDFATDDLIFYGNLEIDTGTAGGMAMIIDQDDIDQTALDFDINNTAASILNMDWGGATTQTAALSGITLDLTNLTTLAGSTTCTGIITVPLDLGLQGTAQAGGLVSDQYEV